MNKYIFISYSRKNKKSVNKIVYQLKEAGFTVWMDTSDIESGEQFKQKIVNAIEYCDVVLYFSSRESNNSHWTAKEIGIASSLNKRIIPIKIDNSPFNKEVYFDIVNINYIDLTDINSRRENINVLISTLKNIFSIPDDINKVHLKPEEILNNKNSYSLKNSILFYKSKLKKFFNLTLKYKTFYLKVLARNLFSSIQTRFVVLVSIFLLCNIFGAIEIHSYIKKCTTIRTFNTKAKLGNILSYDGRILVTSEPRYDIYIDCGIGVSDNNISSQERIEIEEEWRYNARELSQELSSFFFTKFWVVYYNKFIEARESYPRGRFISICKGVDKFTLDTISRMPLLRKGQFKGGLIVVETDARSYPYGGMARRILGYSTNDTKIGIQGQFDSILRGRDGNKCIKYINIKGLKKEFVISEIPKSDGADIRTTLSTHMQQVVDNVLRKYINNDINIHGGTVTIMDVKTGAIRAMSNIIRLGDTINESVGEGYNFAVAHKFEPGTILGAVSLTSFLLKYDDIYKSVWNNVDSLYPFKTAIHKISNVNNAFYKNAYLYVNSILQNSKTSNLRAIDGIINSNPYALAGMSFSHYGELDKYLDLLKNLTLTEDLNFDIKVPGGGKPVIADPKVSDDYNYFLASLGCGYGIAMTPLQILTFYNIIANKGVKVKPYIIESIENGSNYSCRHIHDFHDNISVIDKRIVSKIDSVMRYAVESGASGITGEAKHQISGLAGHSLKYIYNSSKYVYDGYTSAYGSYWNSSFVGYFPDKQPQYSIICTIFTNQTHKKYPGNDIPAKIVSEIYNKLYKSY